MRIPKLCENSGRAYATIPGSGGKRRKYFGVYGSKAAEKAYREWLARVLPLGDLAATADDQNATTVAQLADAFQTWADGYYSPGEAENVACALRPLVTMFGSTRAATFGPLSLASIQKHLVSERYRRGVVNSRVNIIKRAFKWGVSQELIPPSVAHGLASVTSLRKGRSEAEESEEVQPVPWRDVEIIIPYLAPTVAAMVRVQFLCGMRPGEVCAMRPADIDRSRSIWIYQPGLHKNDWRGQPCIKAVPPAAQEILSPFLARDPDAYCFDPREADAWARAQTAKPARKTPVYPSEIKRREAKKAETAAMASRMFSAESYYRSIMYGFARAEKRGVTAPRWHPHQLRHSIANEIDSALGREAAQHWLGHAKLDTTAIYVQRHIGNMVSLAERIQPLLASVMKPADPVAPSAS